jgi:Methylamine utilisation protein MauE
MIDPAISTLLAGAFALLFATAAFHKVRDLDAFSQVFGAYQIVPAGPSVAALVPALEAAVAAGLVVPASRPVAGLTGAVLLLSYAVAIAVNLRRGRRELSCGCGGPDERRPIAAWMVIRNLLLTPALAAVALPLSARPLGPADWLTVAGGLGIAALLYVSADRLLGRVAPRSAAWETR